MLNRIHLQPELESILAADDAEALKQAESDGWTPDRIFEALRDYQLHPLVLAASKGAKNCLKYLLTQPTQYPQFLPYALVDAILEDQIDTARLLVEFGVDLCPEPYSDDSDEDSPISAAMARCNPQLVRLLCEAGAVQVSDPGWLNDAMRMGLRSRRKGKARSLALLAQAILERLETEETLALDLVQVKRLQQALRKTSGDETGSESPELLATQLGSYLDGEQSLREEAIELATAEDDISKLRDFLLALDVVKRRDLAAMVLPYIAPDMILPEVYSFFIELLSWKPDLNRLSDGGKPALHPVARNGHLGILKDMIANGAKINVVDGMTGKTELDWAGYEWEENDVTRYLRSIGAKTGDEIRARQAEAKA